MPAETDPAGAECFGVPFAMAARARRVGAECPPWVRHWRSYARTRRRRARESELGGADPKVCSQARRRLTLALIVFTGIVGAYLARRQGLSVLTRAQKQMARGEVPAGSLADGVMILVAGALLMTPGIFTDAFGFSLLVPGFRNLIKDTLLARFRKAVEENRLHVHVSGMGFDADSGPVVDSRPESFEPDPPKYKVH